MADVIRERWQQRLDEFGRTLGSLSRTAAIQRDHPLTEAEEAGLVQFFELAVEVGWKTLAAYMKAEGLVPRNLTPLTILREAAKLRLVADADAWTDAIERRNIMSHV